jgi:plasmid maintenance system antidote protein VapI
MKTPDIFNYTDASAFLRDCRKAKIYPMTLSFRNLAGMLGVTHSTVFQLVQGKKPSPATAANALPHLLKLPKAEADYLRLLLYFPGLGIDKNFRARLLSKFNPIQKDFDPRRIARNIRRLRIHHGLSIEKFAKLLGVTSRQVNRWQSNDSVISLPHAVAICRIFRLSMDAFCFSKITDRDFHFGEGS